MEDPPDGGMRALHDAENMTFGAAIAQGAELDQHLVALHGVANLGRGDKYVSLKLAAHGFVVWAHKAVAVAVHYQAPDDEVAIDGFGGQRIAAALGLDEASAANQLFKQIVEAAAFSTAQAHFANELLVSGGVAGLSRDVLEDLSFVDHRCD
jgi:hypothetical protein